MCIALPTGLRQNSKYHDRYLGTATAQQYTKVSTLLWVQCLAQIVRMYATKLLCTRVFQMSNANYVHRLHEYTTQMVPKILQYAIVCANLLH